MTVPRARALLAGAQAQLEEAGVASPRVDAEILLANCLGESRSFLATDPTVLPVQQAQFDATIARRAAREPLQHIIGQAWFRHLTLAVGPGVFIPRPETETLVDLALEELARRRGSVRDVGQTIVDLCTGSAAIPIAIATEARESVIYGVELSPQALGWAQRNVQVYDDLVRSVGSSMTLIDGDATNVVEVLPELVGRVDVLTCNPPYIPSAAIPRDQEVRDFDPDIALYGGADGLDVVKGVIAQAAQLLVPDGYLLIEHGDEQGVGGGPLGVPELLEKSSTFRQVQDHLDLAGRPRVTTARRV